MRSVSIGHRTADRAARHEVDTLQQQSRRLKRLCARFAHPARLRSGYLQGVVDVFQCWCVDHLGGLESGARRSVVGCSTTRGARADGLLSTQKGPAAHGPVATRREAKRNARKKPSEPGRAHISVRYPGGRPAQAILYRIGHVYRRPGGITPTDRPRPGRYTALSSRLTAKRQ